MSDWIMEVFLPMMLAVLMVMVVVLAGIAIIVCGQLLLKGD